MLQSVQSTVAIVSGVVGLVCGMILYVRSSAVREYAAKNDFHEIQKQYESLANMVLRLGDELESLDRSVIEIKVLLYKSNSANEFREKLK